MKYILLIFIFFTASFPEFAAANTPCSGRKGGISHCVGRTFICNDGSTSASTKDCSAYMGGVQQTANLSKAARLSWNHQREIVLAGREPIALAPEADIIAIPIAGRKATFPIESNFANMKNPENRPWKL